MLVYDVIIVGAGPAGATAGRVAGQMGLKALIIEKEMFPRYKACAGAVSKLAMSYLDFGIPESLIEKEIYGASVHFKEQSLLEYKEDILAILVTRSEFDNFLLDKARETEIDVLLSERVTGIDETRDEVIVSTNCDRYAAKYVIIAEGAHGNLKHLVRRKDKSNEVGVCAVAEIGEDREVIDNYSHNAIALYYGLTHRGYGWVFPHDDYYSVGIGGLARDMKAPKDTLMKFVQQRELPRPDRINVHLIPSGGVKRRVATSRILLCGDAAGFVDAFTGEGISYAIRSGQIAANAINDSLSSGRGNMRKYRQDCDRDFGSDLRCSLLLAKLMHCCPALMLKVFTSHEIVFSRFLDIPSLALSYRKYLLWLAPRLPKYILS